ncbi:hypothetical protein GCM10027053_19600 [Intrasporangium mesophilum]
MAWKPRTAATVRVPYLFETSPSNQPIWRSRAWSERTLGPESPRARSTTGGGVGVAEGGLVGGGDGGGVVLGGAGGVLLGGAGGILLGSPGGLVVTDPWRTCVATA